MNSELKKLDRSKIPCKYERVYWEDVAGDGGSRMEMSDCAYDGNIDISGSSSCDKSCPAFTPFEVKVCEKHNAEYIDDGDGCGQCWNEAYERGGGF